MTRFRYKAVAGDGNVVEGEIEAPDQQGVIDRIHAMGHVPVRAEPAAGPRAHDLDAMVPVRAGRGALDVQIAFSRDLASLLKAGLPLDRALAVLIDTGAEERIRTVLAAIRERVRGGQSLSEALKTQPRYFSPLTINMTRAGESGGVLAQVLARLADYLERSKQLRESVKTALLYPVILVVVGVLSLIVLLAFVVPQFQALFADAGKALPLPTAIVIAAAGFIRHWGGVALLLVVALAAILMRSLRNPMRRRVWDAWLLRWPLLGEVLAKIEMARAARTLGTLLGSGVALLNALAIARDTLGNQAMAAAMERIIDGVRQGQGMGELMLEVGVFPRLAAQLVRVGEETGQLQSMLSTIADIYDQDVERSVRRMLAILEPILILIMAVFIASIIISILIGILATNELVA